LEAELINPVCRFIFNVPVEVHVAAREADRILRQPAPDGSVVVAGAVVLQVELGVVLATGE
jgi:hypothetical protein